MRPIKFVVLATLCATSVSASWFGSDIAAPEYTQWNQKELEAWLHAHNINVPQGYNKEQIQKLVEANWKSTAAWTNEQYQAAQKRYSGLKEDAFAAWDESTLRQFLLEQGIVAPSSTREQLVLMAKQQYRSYTSAASSLSAAASTAVYGDKTYQASASASSAAAQASATVARALDDSKDYIYSTWDDNQLRTWLEERGYIKTKQQAKRDELLAKMREHYVAASNPIWKAWSDSYMHEWLVNHGIIRSDAQKKRDEYIAQLQSYYYGPRDTVYDTWSESELKQWLVDHGVIKSDAQVKKEKLQALVADNYAAASDTIWGGWHDSEMRDWLIQHGYLRSDAQVKRDELVKLMNDKYADASARSAEYLKWPDARLRAYLRSNGMSEEYLPTSRPTLLHEVRIRYVQAQNRVEAFLQAIRDTMTGGVEAAEEKLGAILEMLGGAQNDAKKEYNAKSKQAQKSVSSVKAEASKSASSAKAEASKSSSSLKAEASRKKEEL